VTADYPSLEIHLICDADRFSAQQQAGTLKRNGERMDGIRIEVDIEAQ